MTTFVGKGQSGTYWPLSANPAAITSKIKPTETPRIWGRLDLNPKFAPDAASMMLFGPGVKAETEANSVNDRMVGKSIRFFFLCEKQSIY